MAALLVLPKIDRVRCTGCGDCVEVCHADTLLLQGKKAVIVNPADCDYCTDCEAVCPVATIGCPLEVVIAA